MKIIIINLFLCFVLLGCNNTKKKEPISEFRTTEIQQNPKLMESMVRGEDLYNNFCVTCHMPNGKGVPKTFPPLANSDYLMNHRSKSIKAIKYGLSGEITVNGETYNMAMTRLGLSNTEIADVMNYITNSWGNKNSILITEKEVSEIKP
jgi:mono/diheme cytochrome c family protein